MLSSKSCKCGSQTGAAYPMGGCIQWIYIVGEVFPGQRAGRNGDTIGPRFSLILAPSICFDQDRSDVSNRPKYLNLGTVSSIWPLIVIVGEGGVIYPVPLA